MALKLYIGNLDKQITVDELAKAFQDNDVQIEKDGIHLKHGFAFIDCPEEVVVDEVLEKLANLTINEKNITVEKAQDRRSSSQTRIVVKNVPESVDEESLASTLGSYGDVKTINKHDHLYLVTYSTSEQAQAAKENLHEIDGQSLQIEFAARKLSRNSFQNQPHKPDCPLKLLIPHVYVGAIIGRGGATIRSITQKTNARVDVVRRDNLLHDEKVVVIVGNETSNCLDACTEILAVMHQEENSPKGELKPELKMLAPNELCGRLIGKHGAIIKSIMSDTETHITVSASPNIGPANCERVVNIRGQSLEGVISATEKVYSKLKSCIEENMNNMRFMNPSNNMLYQHGAMLPTYQQWGAPVRQPFMNANPYVGLHAPQNHMGGHMTVYLYIPKTSVGAVIGSKGTFINYVKQDSRASCQIQERKDDVEAVDRPVKITGYQDGVWRACFHIFNKIKTEGFIQTDNDPIDAELIVPKAAVGRIIGKAGQNVRQIQEVTQCSVKLPEKQNQEEEEVAVLINGPFYYVILAQSLIRHLLLYGQLPPRNLPAIPMYHRGPNYNIRPQRPPYQHAANNVPNHDHGDH